MIIEDSTAIFLSEYFLYKILISIQKYYIVNISL